MTADPYAGFTRSRKEFPSDDGEKQMRLCKNCSSPLYFQLFERRWKCPNADDDGVHRRRKLSMSYASKKGTSC